MEGEHAGPECHFVPTIVMRRPRERVAVTVTGGGVQQIRLCVAAACTTAVAMREGLGSVRGVSQLDWNPPLHSSGTGTAVNRHQGFQENDGWCSHGIRILGVGCHPLCLL